MCKSMVGAEYRGERPIEQSGSWFPPKCVVGQHASKERLGRAKVALNSNVANKLRMSLSSLYLNGRITYLSKRSGRVLVSRTGEEE